jgi:hypothetical protein
MATHQHHPQQPGCLAGLFRRRRQSESPSPSPDDGPAGRPGRTPTPAAVDCPPSPSACSEPSLPAPAAGGGHARIGSGVDLHTLLQHVMPSKEAAIKVAPVAVGGEARCVFFLFGRAHGRAHEQKGEARILTPALPTPTPPSPLSTRSDGQIAYGYSLMRGRRATMEDFHHAAVR